MLQNILNLNGAQKLSKTEQQTIHGGGLDCSNLPTNTRCGGGGQICCGGVCSYTSPCDL